MNPVQPHIPSDFNDQNRVRFIHGGKPYFDLVLELIGKASESIHLQTYIFDDDETGQMIAQALIRAVERQVKVYLLADGYASQNLSARFIHQLRDAGVQFRFFEPFFKSKNFYFGRRMHHKIFVADARYAVVGGINISNRYNDLPDSPSWLDYALFAEGSIARDLCVLCWKTWKSFPVKMGITPCEGKVIRLEPENGEKCEVRMRRNDWIRRKNEISATYIEMFRNAKSHITIVCSYFLPGKLIRRLLSHAIKRGVRIRVITAGPSDVWVSKSAERWMYDWLLRNKIELYEYQPVVLHAKVAVCDGEWFTIGSYNINNLSTYASIELNLDVRNRSMAGDLERDMENMISRDCIHITKVKRHYSRNILRQFIRWASYQFLRVVFYLLTFYFKQKRNQ
ncbi:MAG: phospholipase [Chitinophagaceae bacterium]|nr:phospholipase [Chitinophagaceae bacterium]MBL0056528.1 phospholipase [Chitinophagaceae bacterium]